MEYIAAKTIVTNTKNRYWFGCEYNMNIYRGCNHNCIYCDSRSACYKIENFENVVAKSSKSLPDLKEYVSSSKADVYTVLHTTSSNLVNKDALNIIEADLRRKKIRGVVCTGAMSDPYNIHEKELCLTRDALKIIDRKKFGVAIATKSDLVLRDIDILKSIASHSPVIVKISITTADSSLAKKLEPYASTTNERFNAVKILSENEIFSGILMMPILPFINDSEENILSIVEKAHTNKAKFIFPRYGVTLRDRQRTYYYTQISKLFGYDIVEKYKKIYGEKYSAISLNYRKLSSMFTKKCREYNILYSMKEIISAYRADYKKEEQYFMSFLKD